MNFEGKNVFVTGAGGYIGSFTAKEFASRGAKVTVFDQNAAGVKKTVDEINAAGGTAIGVTGDVTSSASVDEAVKSAVERMGGLDIMVHAAGGSARDENRPLVQQTDEVIDRIIKVNLYGAFYTARAAARIMIAQGRGGRIIPFSSVIGYNGCRNLADYSAAKGGVIAMVKSLAKELGEYKITVNSVAPGIVMRPEEKASDHRALETNELHQKCTAADVAKLVCFLASEDAGFITGQTYVVDGGRGLALKGTD